MKSSASTLVRYVHRYAWGNVVKFQGTCAELKAAGVLQDYMLEQLGKQQTRRGPTEFGDQFELKRLSGDRLNVVLYVYDDPDCFRAGGYQDDATIINIVDRIARQPRS